MRAVGYTVETAIADLVDNSLAAGSSQVHVLFEHADNPYIAIVDNGRGMTRDVALVAMQLAGTAGLSDRDATDLGRFGLGLKTASLSQCRELTVVSKLEGGSMSGFRWDLDRLAETGRWTLQELNKTEISKLPRMDVLRTFTSGTLVLWRKLDQFQNSHGDDASAFDSGMNDVKDHLGLVFHRYLSGEWAGKPVEMTVNYSQIRPADPFLSGHRLTQRSPEEVIRVGDEAIRVQSFTLPYLAKLTASDRERARLQGNLRDSQGFYVYRAGRLVIWATWFRTQKRSETVKLARVRVDIPNTLDSMWSLDVKKSHALPPPAVLTKLRALASRFSEPSKRTTTSRGRKEGAGKILRLWDHVQLRDGFRYQLNRDHPLIATALQSASGPSRAVEAALQAIEEAAPFHDAYIRLSSDEAWSEQQVDETPLREAAGVLWASLSGRMSPEQFIASFSLAEPFADHPKASELLKEVISG